MTKALNRCAIYTRKSNEEGLEQDFNSLDAQREACAAYVTSQASLGWKLLPRRYDDGGISGGHMDRPALQELLHDIEAGRIDTVVVYKIDRLTRSLSDFSKRVEIFDKHQVSFVSVTQQFNTTTSMGRLTLNVLLSFAQFEREVTAERIRDKIAASRQKGMWMGGRVPLGYDVIDKRLIVNQPEAELVRRMFALYLKLRSVPKLKEECDRLGLRTKDRTAYAGKPFRRGHLYAMLTNPLYTGQVRHRGETYEGQHKPIVDNVVFEQVQAQIHLNACPRRVGRNNPSQHLLTGLLFDNTGDPLSPSHAVKKGKRYLYYVSLRLKANGKTRDGGWRLNAQMIEGAVLNLLKDQLSRPECLLRLVDKAGQSGAMYTDMIEAGKRAAIQLDSQSQSEKRDFLVKLVKRIDLASDSISIQIDMTYLSTLARGVDATKPKECRADGTGIIVVPLQFRKHRRETRLVIGDQTDSSNEPDHTLISLIARAHHWLRCLTDGQAGSIIELARLEQVDKNTISRTLKFAYLAPDITMAILEGRHPPTMTADTLRRLPELPMDWQAQHTLLGFV